MKDPNLVMGILNISSGALFILLSIPLVAKKVPMNSLYGFRISKAFESEENWYEVNRYGGRQLIRWSILLIVIGILHFIFPTTSANSSPSNILLTIAPILICPAVAIVKTLLFSKQL
jgi:hypothetical protein